MDASHRRLPTVPAAVTPMTVLLLFVAAIGLASSTSRGTTKSVVKYRSFTFPKPLQISDDELLIKNLSSFVHDHRRSGGNAHGNQTLDEPVRRWYVEIVKSQPYHVKLINLMKHCVYATQDRLKYLARILDKYQDDLCFRIGYIFTKLDQTLEDIRRIYTYALKNMHYKRIEENIYFYKHLTKKNIEVTYIVEFMNSQHERNLKNLARYNSHFATDLIDK